MRVFIIALSALLIVAPTPAFAYLDPGTGSMILQGIIGAIAGLMVAGKLYWGKLVSFFSSSKKSDSDDDKISK